MTLPRSLVPQPRLCPLYCILGTPLPFYSDPPICLINFHSRIPVEKNFNGPGILTHLPNSWMEAVDAILVFPRLKQKQSVSFHFLKTKELDVAGLRLVLSPVTSRSISRRGHLHPATNVVVIVRSSMKALIGGCRVPDLNKGALHSTSAKLHKHIKLPGETGRLWNKHSCLSPDNANRRC